MSDVIARQRYWTFISCTQCSINYILLKILHSYKKLIFLQKVRTFISIQTTHRYTKKVPRRSKNKERVNTESITYFYESLASNQDK